MDKQRHIPIFAVAMQQKQRDDRLHADLLARLSSAEIDAATVKALAAKDAEIEFLNRMLNGYNEVIADQSTDIARLREALASIGNMARGMENTAEARDENGVCILCAIVDQVEAAIEPCGAAAGGRG